MLKIGDAEKFDRKSLPPGGSNSAPQGPVIRRGPVPVSMACWHPIRQSGSHSTHRFFQADIRIRGVNDIGMGFGKPKLNDFFGYGLGLTFSLTSGLKIPTPILSMRGMPHSRSRNNRIPQQDRGVGRRISQNCFSVPGHPPQRVTGPPGCKKKPAGQLEPPGVVSLWFKRRLTQENRRNLGVWEEQKSAEASIF